MYVAQLKCICRYDDSDDKDEDDDSDDDDSDDDDKDEDDSDDDDHNNVLHHLCSISIDRYQPSNTRRYTHKSHQV